MLIKKQMSKKILIILLCFIMLLAFLPINSVMAATTYTQILKSGIDSFPEEYKTILKQLKKLHPNWNFESYYTGMDWSTVVLNETSTHGRNRIIKSSDEAYKCSCGNVASGYACASEGIVKYYLDPRNFLNEVNIFQFLEISYNKDIYSLEGVQSAVKNTFLDDTITYKLIESKENEDGEKEDIEVEYTKTYPEIILEAAEASNMSPYSIVTKIIQEVGTKGSNSVRGTYEGYTGYYNFFNLGAYDTGNAIVNALKYARDKGWNNQYTAIIEGSKQVANSYTNAGQNTPYFYKWDVVGTKVLKAGETQSTSSSNMFWHQYMTNVQDPTSQSKTLYNTYVKNGIIDKNLNFIIPIYNNMPKEISQVPTGLTTDDGDLYYVNCTDGLSVREKPTTSSSRLSTLYKNTVVVVLERECTEANGYKWDKVKLSNGLTGYIASKYLTFKSGSTKSNDTPVNTGNEKNDTPAEENYKIDAKKIVVVPGIKLSDINGNVVGELKTGAKITMDGKEYTVIVKGDVNGDGNIDALDALKILKYDVGLSELKNEFLEAGNVNSATEVNALDALKILKYDVNLVDITL